MPNPNWTWWGGATGPSKSRPVTGAGSNPWGRGPVKPPNTSFPKRAGDRFSRTRPGTKAYARYWENPVPLRTSIKSGYKAVERASMRIPARRFVLGGAAIVGAGYVMNKMMNRRKDNFYTHYFDY